MSTTTPTPWWRSFETGTLPPDVAAVLVAARHRRGWTRQGAAAAIGCSPGNLGALERGTRRPSVALATDLIRVLQLSDDDAARLLECSARYSGRSSPYRTGAKPRPPRVSW